MSDYWLRNGSFLRCENITVGYTWPSLLKDQLRLRLYGAVQNPFVITKYKGLDPEEVAVGDELVDVGCGEGDAGGQQRGEHLERRG